MEKTHCQAYWTYEDVRSMCGRGGMTPVVEPETFIKYSSDDRCGTCTNLMFGSEHNVPKSPEEITLRNRDGLRLSLYRRIRSVNGWGPWNETLEALVDFWEAHNQQRG